jgi:hypothetical protein
MKSWKTRVGLVCTMLAMVLAVSIPAVAVDVDDFEDVVEDEFAAAEDVDCSVEDEDGDGLFEEDVVDGLDNDFDGSTDEEIVCVVEFEVDDFDTFAAFDEFDDDDDNDNDTFAAFDEFDDDNDNDNDNDNDDNDNDDNERESSNRIFR